MENNAMAKRPLILGSVFLIIAAFVYLYASPYLMLNSLKTALQEGDKIALREKVDFALLKESIKEQLQVAMIDVLGSEDGGIAGFAAFASTMMIDKMVDSYATPSGAIKAYNKFSDSHKKSEFPPAYPPPSGESKPKQFDDSLKVAHMGLNLFTVEGMKDDVRLIVKRELFTWKVIDIEFLDAFNAFEAKKSEMINHASAGKEFFDRTCGAYRDNNALLFEWAKTNLQSGEDRSVHFRNNGNATYYLYEIGMKSCIVLLTIPADSGERFSGQAVFDAFKKDGFINTETLKDSDNDISTFRMLKGNTKLSLVVYEKPSEGFYVFEIHAPISS